MNNWRLYKNGVLEIQDKHTWEQTLCEYPLLKAAGGIVCNPRGELLMILKRGKWDLPKGGLEQGETLEQCAIREVQEECGVTGIKIIAFAATTYHTYLETDGIEYLKETVWYKMECDNCQEPHPQTQEDITQAVWAAPAQVQANLQNSYGTIYDLLAVGV
jgi:8-oxo-dGTP pyrophosphatase MutT (NUDIX family)